MWVPVAGTGFLDNVNTDHPRRPARHRAAAPALYRPSNGSLRYCGSRLPGLFQPRRTANSTTTT